MKCISIIIIKSLPLANIHTYSFTMLRSNISLWPRVRIRSIEEYQRIPASYRCIHRGLPLNITWLVAVIFFRIFVEINAFLFESRPFLFVVRWPIGIGYGGKLLYRTVALFRDDVTVLYRSTFHHCDGDLPEQGAKLVPAFPSFSFWNMK